MTSFDVSFRGFLYTLTLTTFLTFYLIPKYFTVPNYAVVFISSFILIIVVFSKIFKTMRLIRYGKTDVPKITSEPKSKKKRKRFKLFKKKKKRKPLPKTVKTELEEFERIEKTRKRQGRRRK